MTISPAVAVTGIGIVTSIGTGRQSFWDAILAGHLDSAGRRVDGRSNHGIAVGVIAILRAALVYGVAAATRRAAALSPR